MSAIQIDAAAMEHARKRLGEALNELKRRGALDDEIMEARPVWIMPFEVVIGQTRRSAVDSEFLWVSGDMLPVDCIDGRLAGTARDAARHFSLRWQIAAESFAKADAKDLIEKAEYLYSLVDDDEVWL